MLRKYLKRSLVHILENRATVMIGFLLMAAVLYHFIRYAIGFQGYDVLRLVHPMKMLFLNYDTGNMIDIHFFIDLYPVLVMIPAGFSYFTENQSGESVYIVSRTGYQAYLWGNVLGAFISTFLVAVVPFLIEIILSCITYPATAIRSLVGWSGLDLDYVEMEQSYFLVELYQISPYLYTLAIILILGTVSGLMGAFTVAFSYIFPVKYKILLMLPAFLILNGTVIANKILQIPVAWYKYLLLFFPGGKLIYLLSFEIAMLLLIVLFTLKKSRSDCL